jgi:hypothetical protein
MSRAKPKSEKPADVRVTHRCVVGGIRRDVGDYLVRDGEMTDGVTPENLAHALLEMVAEFVTNEAAS